MPTRVHLSLSSSNSKTGPIPVSTSSCETCPQSCPLRATCYAKLGPLRFHWNAVSTGTRGIDWDAFCKEIKKFPAGQLWRHNQAGDLPGRGELVDKTEMAKLILANKGKCGFTYTHKRKPSAIEEIRKANAEGFTVNLSADGLTDADKLLAKYPDIPVVATIPSTTKKSILFTPGGKKVCVCPAAIRADKMCFNCGLCQKKSRDFIIAFPSHGVRKYKLDSFLAAKEKTK